MKRHEIIIENPARFAARMAYYGWLIGFFAGVILTLALAIVFR